MQALGHQIQPDQVGFRLDVLDLARVVFPGDVKVLDIESPLGEDLAGIRATIVVTGVAEDLNAVAGPLELHGVPVIAMYGTGADEQQRIVTQHVTGLRVDDDLADRVHQFALL